MTPDPGPEPAWGDPDAQRRLLILVYYEGPFERLMNRLWCLDDSAPDGVWREVREGSLRNWLACRAEGLDRSWRQWHVRHRRPAARWLRKLPGEDA